MMTSEELQQFLSKANHAIIGTNRANAGPQLTPVWYYWDGTAFYFSTTKDRAKYPNIKRDPNISLIVDDLASRKYVVAYGQAEVIEQGYGDLLRPLLAKYMPAENVEQALAGTVANPARVLVVVRPSKIITN
jgi:PPOX class probable F420-dependent enzyme